MNGVPDGSLEHLQKLVLELYATQAVLDCRLRASRRLLTELCQTLKVHFRAYPSLNPEQLLTVLTDEELDHQMAKISDGDPAHVAYMMQIIRAAKSSSEPS